MKMKEGKERINILLNKQNDATITNNVLNMFVKLFKYW